MPWSFATECGQDGFSFECSQLEKIADFGTGIAPLFPVAHPYSAPEPFVYLRDRPVVLRDPIIVHPAPYIFRQFLIPVIHRDEPTPSGQQTNLSLELPERCITPSDFATYEDKTKKAALLNRCHFALLFVDLKLQLVFQEPADTGHHPFTCTQTLHHDNGIVGVPAEAVTTTFQFLVQIVEKNVGKQW